MKFSFTYIPQKVRLYRLSHLIYSPYIMCQIQIKFPDPEYTVYKYVSEDDSLFQTHSILFDPREYSLINIHEDVPGIDHVGIVHYISGLFYKENIPLLYLNSYGYNLILVSDEFFEKAITILNKITNN